MIPVLITKLASMILLIFVGLFIVRIGVVRSEDSKVVSKLVVKVFTPCLIINSFMSIELTGERVFGFVTAAVFGCLVYCLWIVAARLLKKPLGLSRVEQATLVYSNVGNLVLPLVSMVLGDEMVFYASAMQISFNVFIWSHCNMLISGEKKINVKKILCNQNMIAVALGLIFMAAGLKLPDVLKTAMSSLGSMVGSLSMLMVGMVIASMNLKDVVLTKRAYLIVFMRLIVFPLLAMGALYVSWIMRRFPELIPIFQITFFALAAPPASTVSQLAVLYDEDQELASVYNVIGTVVCLVTIPFVLYVYGAVFGA